MVKMHPRIAGVGLLAGVLLAALASAPARADIAPPDAPPGSNPVPGVEVTQVEMIAETVTINMQPSNWSGPVSQQESLTRDWATVHAEFTMRNTGAVEERMRVQFPLEDPSGWSDLPEIQDLSVEVGGRRVATRRITTPGAQEGYSVAWAAFDVVFPPNEDVAIEVNYATRATGYAATSQFIYILSTGSGWKGEIGRADFVVRAPYDLTPENVILRDWATTTDPTFDGRDVRWHFEGLEPTATQQIAVTFVSRTLWNEVLAARAGVDAHPNDGEAWGRLARAYREAACTDKGWARDDEGAQTMVRMSVEAYERATDLAPERAKWHAGYAELLYRAHFFSDPRDPLLVLALQQIDAALRIEPANQQAWDVLAYLSGQVPEAVQISGDTPRLLILTATLLPPPETLGPPRATQTMPPVPLATQAPTQTPALAPQSSPTAGGASGSGGLQCLGEAVALAVLAPFAAVIVRRKRTMP